MRNFIFCFFLIFLVKCTDKKYEKYHSFSNNIWNTDSTIIFNFPINDTTKSYDFILKIRHSVYYEFQNLFIFLEGSKNDTIEIILADKIGKWIGGGISDVREVEYVLDSKRTFVKKEDYKLRITQAMRYGSKEKIQNLGHILTVGIIVLEHDE
jgi:gliding motility-associated lipoprotein GldH